MLRGILLGSVSGLALSGLFLISVSLLVPPTGSTVSARVPDRPDAVTPPAPDETAVTRPEPLPRRAAPADTSDLARSEVAPADAIEIPAGSQFGRPREELALVTPDEDERPQMAASAGPGGPAVPPSAPVADTRSADIPGTARFTALAPPPTDGTAPTVPAAIDERAPQTFRPVEVVEESVEQAEAPEVASETASVTVEPGEAADEPAVAEVVSSPSDASDAEATTEIAADVAETSEPEIAAAEPETPAPLIDDAAPDVAGETEPRAAEVAAAAIEPASPAPLVEETAPEIAPAADVTETETAPDAEPTALVQAEAEPVLEDEAPAPIVSEAAPVLGDGPNGLQLADAATTTDGAPLGALDSPVAQVSPSQPAAAETGRLDPIVTAATEPALPDVTDAAPAGGPIASADVAVGLEPAPAAAPVQTAQLSEPAIRILRPDEIVIPERTPAPTVIEDAAPSPSVAGADVAAASETVLPRRLVLDSERPDEAPEVDVPEAAASDAPRRALDAFAAEVDRQDGVPNFSIVLIDDPAAGVDRTALAEFNLPITFAIDPTAPDAVDAMATYRAAGREVLLLADALSPDGAPQDIEIALAGARAAVPEAVGVLDRAQLGFAGRRAALTTLLPALQEAGMGFVGYPGGLGSGIQTALREGVPAAQLYRVLDDQDQQSPMIGRFLDRATFEAAQDGSAIVVGRTVPETVEALQAWSLGNRVQTVNVVPISEVLRGALP